MVATANESRYVIPASLNAEVNLTALVAACAADILGVVAEAAAATNCGREIRDEGARV